MVPFFRRKLAALYSPAKPHVQFSSPGMNHHEPSGT
jgi:hypothetical protein